MQGPMASGSSHSGSRSTVTTGTALSVPLPACLQPQHNTTFFHGPISEAATVASFCLLGTSCEDEAE